MKTTQKSPRIYATPNKFCSFPCVHSEVLVPEAFKEHDTYPQAPLEKRKKSLKHPFIFLIRQKAIYHSLNQSPDLCALNSPAETGAVLAGDGSPCHRTQPQFSGQLLCLLSLAADSIPALVCSFSSIFEAFLQPLVKLCCVN